MLPGLVDNAFGIVGIIVSCVFVVGWFVVFWMVKSLNLACSKNGLFGAVLGLGGLLKLLLGLNGCIGIP